MQEVFASDLDLMLSRRTQLYNSSTFGPEHLQQKNVYLNDIHHNHAD
jgi:hypothetical protein